MVTGSTYTWELRDLPFIEEEPASPSVTYLVPRVAISYFPAAGSHSSIGKSFGNWTEVSQWLTQLSDPQATLNDAITAKVNALVAGKLLFVEDGLVSLPYEFAHLATTT